MTERDFGGADEVARPALQAYTTSAQAAASGKKGAGRKNEGKKRRVAPPPMRRGKKEAEIKFDEDARRDFLTGFRKRKQARIEKGRDKAKQREKDERKLMRTQAREERKKQAAENVKAERIAYGAVASDDNEEEGEDDDEEEVEEEQKQSAYNSESHHTTVTIEEFDPNADLDAPTKPTAPVVKKKAKQERSVEALPPSSRRAAKRKQKDAGDISKLISVEEERKNAYVPEALRLQEEEEAQEELQPGGMGGVEKKRKAAERKPKFHYETKLERAKNKAAIREMNQKRAEKRREENRGKHNARRGGRGGRGGKR